PTSVVTAGQPPTANPNGAGLVNGDLTRIVAVGDRPVGDTAAVEPWGARSAGEAGTSPATREDGPLPAWAPSLGTEAAVDAAPDAEEGHFTVPRVIGG
ncbi:MAG: Asp-tRNA(Asn)/Glu-tRNA(Gln) amidotransferase subunit GatC, partial [Blastocatellia bacterium]